MIEPARYTTVDAALSRTEHAVQAITHLAERAAPGARLGTKGELQEWCGVAKGTFNEALRILQSRGVISVRPGPGGGLFVASPTPIARLGNSILSLDAAEGDVADAVRIRDALDPLLIEDALAHGSATDIARMRADLAAMQRAIDQTDATDFVHSNWKLHATIARVSPNAILKSIYLSLLDLIESHTVSVEPTGEEPLWDYIRQRYQLHIDLVDAIDSRDRHSALRLIHTHNTTQGEGPG
ncbi:FCD domain-containing protein [Nocardia sp. NEAU-G5]|uniref:FCD domain-containing protein n=1 Tax=Nocardia albiluteola TaxID=2842303 RepID=A0ABS6BDA6_9NOCA|nr:FCD domain-containing protein [Nocardia albiluteola]MBU3067756.1 FCD domain-containing protein [Nocardia albiluteola]